MIVGFWQIRGSSSLGRAFSRERVVSALRPFEVSEMSLPIAAAGVLRLHRPPGPRRQHRHALAGNRQLQRPRRHRRATGSAASSGSESGFGASRSLSSAGDNSRSHRRPHPVLTADGAGCRKWRQKLGLTCFVPTPQKIRCR